MGHHGTEQPGSTGYELADRSVSRNDNARAVRRSARHPADVRRRLGVPVHERRGEAARRALPGGADHLGAFHRAPDRHAGRVPAAVSLGTVPHAAAGGAARPLGADAGQQPGVRHGDRRGAARHRIGDRLHLAAARHRAVGAAAARAGGMAAMERGGGRLRRRADGDPPGQRIPRSGGAVAAVLVVRLRAVPDRHAPGRPLRQRGDRHHLRGPARLAGHEPGDAVHLRDAALAARCAAVLPAWDCWAGSGIIW